MLQLKEVPNSNTFLWTDMWEHYSQPNGFVGRNICYLIYNDGVRYGSIVGGSATLFLPGRQNFYLRRGIQAIQLEEVINNTFFHIQKVDGKYPTHNFVPKVLAAWRMAITRRWIEKYGNFVIGFEALVELPRSGECYLRDKWIAVGETKGYTCKRLPGKGSDNWTGRRKWNTTEVAPKLVFCRMA